MKIQPTRLHYLLEQYAENRCTEEEMKELFTGIAASGDDATFNQELEAAWKRIGLEKSNLHTDSNGIFREIEQRIALSNGKVRRFSWWKAAAVFILIAGSISVYFISRPQKKDMVTALPVKKEFSKPEHKLLQLPDGSTVLLNNNSSLEVSPSFAGSLREVTLIGEAYFDIKKDSAHPFIIHTGKLSTKVLGTSFNIRAYGDEEDVTVTVTRGRVKVESGERTLGVLTPDQQLSFNKSNNTSVQQQVMADSVIGWKQNDLLFDNSTFEEAAAEISRRYGVQVVFENEKMKSCRFHASFLNEYQVEQVLMVLCDLNHAQYEIKNKTVIIKGEGCD